MHREQPRIQPGVDRQPADGDDVGDEQDAGRDVKQHDQSFARAANPCLRPIGEDESKVQEERRQQQRGHHVGPVEVPIEPIQSAERKRQRAEKREAQPEEVQRRRIVRPPQADGRTDEQREDADGGANHIQRRVAGGHGRHVDVEHSLLAQAQHRI